MFWWRSWIVEVYVKILWVFAWQHVHHICFRKSFIIHPTTANAAALDGQGKRESQSSRAFVGYRTIYSLLFLQGHLVGLKLSWCFCALTHFRTGDITRRKSSDCVRIRNLKLVQSWLIFDLEVSDHANKTALRWRGHTQLVLYLPPVARELWSKEETGFSFHCKMGCARSRESAKAKTTSQQIDRDIKNGARVSRLLNVWRSTAKLAPDTS